jgi:acyl-CoA reductase-like NAD-dependent aldehyde dehydrogenase
MKMLIGGAWQAAANGRTEDVTSPFDGTVTGTVPVAGPDDGRAAVDRAESGAVTRRRRGLPRRAGAQGGGDQDPAP